MIMTQAQIRKQIRKLIFVSGIKPKYIVHTHGFDGCESFEITSYRVAVQIVGMLRQQALLNPDRFPKE
jgi:hypothetical protein